MIAIARDQVTEPLYAIVPYYNPWRFKSRVKHTERALKHFHDSGAVIVLVEIAFNRRQLIFADSGLDGTAADCKILGTDSKYRHKYIGLRTKDELWLKENAINIGVQSLPYDWQQVCWLDSDIHFARPNWVGESIHKLQHGTNSDAAFLQMFSHAADLGPNYEILPTHYPHAQGISFSKAWQQGSLRTTLTPQILADLQQLGGDLQKLLKDFMQLEEDISGNYYGQDSTKRVWPGLAWAATRKAWDSVGGLPDYAIWGGGDWSMAHALVGKQDGMMHTGLHPNYRTLTTEWYNRAQQHIRRNVLTMDGTLLHHWHGRKTQRGYADKHRLLAKYGFDPLRHLKRDSQNIWQFHDDGSESYIQMREAFRRIATERSEDSIDTGIETISQGH